MKPQVGTLIGFVIGAALMAIPLAYLYGQSTAQGVASSYVVKAIECERDAEKFKAMITRVEPKPRKRKVGR